MYSIIDGVSSRGFCKRGHNGLFKILGGAPCSVGVWSANSKGGHIGFERWKMPPRPLNELRLCALISTIIIYIVQLNPTYPGGMGPSGVRNF